MILGDKRQPSETALKLHKSNVVADLHVDLLLTHHLFGYDITKRHSHPLPFSPLVCQSDLPRLNDAGMNILGLGLVTNPLQIFHKFRFGQVWKQMQYLHKVCESQDNGISIITDRDLLKQVLADKKMGAFCGIEGAHTLDGDLETLPRFYDMGVRYLTLAHFTGNQACNCAMGKNPRKEGGLTGFGKALVDRIHKYNMVLDLAHVERQAFLDACARSERPVIVSHTGVQGAHKIWRNIDDMQLEAVAKTNGVVGIMIAPQYMAPGLFCDLDVIADHIMHAVKTIGPDHVAYGSDLDGWIWTMPSGFDDVTDLPLITDILLEKGLSQKDVKKIIGSNVSRVLKECLA